MQQTDFPPMQDKGIHSMRRAELLVLCKKDKIKVDGTIPRHEIIAIIEAAPKKPAAKKAAPKKPAEKKE